MKKSAIKKTLLSAVCFIALAYTCYAQDIIVTKDSRRYNALVTEVNVDNVRFRLYENQDGLVYTLLKSDILTIIYRNGYVETFQTPAQTAFNQQSSFYNSNINSQQQQFPIQKYSFGKQINPYGPEKNSFLAGFLSFLVPGVGQFYNGDVGCGFLFLGCNIICNSLWMNSIETDYYGNVYVNEQQLAIGLIGALTVNVWSIVNASQVAKRVNIARGYRLADNTYLQIQPTIIQRNNLLANKDNVYGMNFRINF